jgi:hypothetical protein
MKRARYRQSPISEIEIIALLGGVGRGSRKFVDFYQIQD